MPHATPDDASDLMQLVAAARAGRRAALSGIFQTVLPELRALVKAHAGSRIRRFEGQDDVVQSICREVLDDLDQFQGTAEPQFRKWLSTLALNKIRDKGRFYSAAKRSPELDAPGDGAAPMLDRNTPTQQLAGDEEQRRIRRTLDDLSEEYRQVIELACLQKLPRGEVAIRLGRSELATRKLLSRARADLMRRLAAAEDAR